MIALLRSLAHGLFSSLRDRASLQLEIMALRHQLEALQRQNRGLKGVREDSGGRYESRIISIGDLVKSVIADREFALVPGSIGSARVNLRHPATPLKSSASGRKAVVGCRLSEVNG